MRIAFLTTEFGDESPESGGLGHYLSRMCHALRAEGHVPEVFVTSDRSQATEVDGVVVHHVNTRVWTRSVERGRPFAAALPRRASAVAGSAFILVRAAALASALRRRDARAAFDAVQSADHQAAGLFVPKRAGRPHIVRSSSAADLGGIVGWQTFWERRSMRRADAVYAPSQFVAHHFRTRHGLDVAVIRPPLLLEMAPSQTSVVELPPRYFFHFGKIGRLKGSDTLAAALPLVWQQQPDFRMVWAGALLDEREWLGWRQGWGSFADRVTYLGPLPKPDLYHALIRAEASVLPSSIDNLPNAVLESLLCDTPVIGTRGSSIDEIVVDEVNGRLVEPRNVRELAAAMCAAWQCGFALRTDLARASPLWPDLQPPTAVRHLVAFVERVRERSRP